MITTKKAIEIIDVNLKDITAIMPPDVKTTLELSRESLLRHQKRHTMTFTGMMEPLPGEEEEKEGD